MSVKPPRHYRQNGFISPPVKGAGGIGLVPPKSLIGITVSRRGAGGGRESFVEDDSVDL